MALALRYFISLGFLPFILNQTTNDLYYCVDWSCEEFISRGKTLLNYAGKTENHLSFRQNEDIKILGKPVNVDGPDWVGSVRKKVGLVPKSMVREDQMGKRSANFKYPLSELLDLLRKAHESNTDTAESPVEEATNTTLGEESTPAQEEERDSTTQSPSVAEAEQVTTTTESTLQPQKEDDSTSESSLIPEEKEVTANTSAPVESVPFKEEKQEPTTESPPVLKSEEEANIVTLSEAQDAEKDSLTASPAVTEITEAEEATANASVTLEVLPTQKEEQVTTTESPLAIEPEDTKEVEPEEIKVADPVESPPLKDDQPDSTTKESPSVTQVEKVTISSTESFPPREEKLDSWTESTLPQEEEEEELHTTPKSPSITEDEEVSTTTAASVESILLEDKDDNDDDEEEEQDESDSNPELPSESETEELGTTAATLVEEVSTTAAPPIESIAPKENEPELTTVAPLLVTEAEEVSTPSSESTVTPQDKEPDSTTDSPSIIEAAEVAATAAASVESIPLQDEPDSTTESSSPTIVEEDTATIAQVESLDSSTASTPVEHIALESDSKDRPPLLSVSHAEDVFTTSNENISSESDPDKNIPTIEEDGHEHGHNHGHAHHHHHHNHGDDGPRETTTSETETSSFVIILKHLSSTLLSFLPEHLQDTILDVDDALVFTGIIALTLISICVPYFLIDGFFAVRPLKKKVVELNKSLWKVSTAYENQQDEYEQYKKKALAYDEDQKRVEQLEYELILLKKLEGKQKEQVLKYQIELKTHKELTTDMQSFLDKEAEKKKKILEEKDKLKTTVSSLKEALRRTTDEFQEAQAEVSSVMMEYGLSKQSNETLTLKSEMLEKELNELRSKLHAEGDKRRAAEIELEVVTKSKAAVESELSELNKICLKYEETVSALNTELEHKENELVALKETLGEDSPLVDIAEVKAKLVNTEETLTSVQSRLESMSLENTSLSRNLKEANSTLSTVQKEREEAMNRLQVLESWFKEKEEDLRKAVERYEAERNIRGKDKDDLVAMLEEKSEEIKQLNSQLEAFKTEFEETKQQHRNEIRVLETKSHENWLSLCQAERKAQDARKEAESLRQRLTALSKEKDEGEGVNGDDVHLYPLITPDMVPLPLPEDVAYFDLHDGFIPPPPLPLDEEREPHRPAPLGRVSPTYSDLDDPISPIRAGREYSDGNSSASESSPRRRSPRGWRGQYNDRDRGREADERQRRTGPVTSSSPLHGFNL